MARKEIPDPHPPLSLQLHLPQQHRSPAASHRMPRSPTSNTSPAGPDTRRFIATSYTFNFRRTPSLSGNSVNAPGHGFIALTRRATSSYG